MLLPEPDNPVDPHAIRVLVDGRHVGYLSRDDAAVYLPGLRRLIASSETGHVALGGQIVGGGPRADGIGFLGVFLDHDPSDFGIAPHYTTGGSLRTGLSDAIATDLEDDSYDLSWLTTLSDDDAGAVAQLRSLLGDERDPIDRHYMLCELEARLYRGRELRAGALDDFDEVCAHHHQEMTELPAGADLEVRRRARDRHVPASVDPLAKSEAVGISPRMGAAWARRLRRAGSPTRGRRGSAQAGRARDVEDRIRINGDATDAASASRSWQRHTRPRLRHSPAPPAARVFTGSGHAGASRRPAPHAAGPQRPTRLGIDPVSRDGAGSWDLGGSLRRWPDQDELPRFRGRVLGW